MWVILLVLFMVLSPCILMPQFMDYIDKSNEQKIELKKSEIELEKLQIERQILELKIQANN